MTPNTFPSPTFYVKEMSYMTSSIPPAEEGCNSLGENKAQIRLYRQLNGALQRKKANRDLQTTLGAQIEKLGGELESLLVSVMDDGSAADTRRKYRVKLLAGRVIDLSNQLKDLQDDAEAIQSRLDSLLNIAESGELQ